MRSARMRRRGILDVRYIAIGDWIVAAAGALALVSLFLPWINTSTPRPHSEMAFTYSPVACALVIFFFLSTLFLVIYPALSPDLRLPPLPFATPLLFFLMGTVLVLIFTYEFGKYACIGCLGVSRGFGIWVALISGFVYLLGAVIKWGSRPSRRS